jgi:hypothetical protein
MNVVDLGPIRIHMANVEVDVAGKPANAYGQSPDVTERVATSVTQAITKIIAIVLDI